MKIFAICQGCQGHRWCTLSCEYLREFSKKFETALLIYSGAWGKLIHEKNRSRKSRGTVPLSPAMGRGIDSRNRIWNWVAKLHRLAGQYNNPMTTWFLAPIAGLKLPTLYTFHSSVHFNHFNLKKSNVLLFLLAYKNYLQSQYIGIGDSHTKMPHRNGRNRQSTGILMKNRLLVVTTRLIWYRTARILYSQISMIKYWAFLWTLTSTGHRRRALRWKS